MTKNTSNNNFPVVILAAGLSERMGIMKPLLPYDTKNTFLDRIVKKFQQYGSSEIIIVANSVVRKKIKHLLQSDIRIVLNENPAIGRLNSLKLGLNALIRKSCCFIHNADNPFIDEALLDKMSFFAGIKNVIIPFYRLKGGHPILIGKKVIDRICSEPKSDADLRTILALFNVISINVSDEKILCNINTHEDYKSIFGKDPEES